MENYKIDDISFSIPNNKQEIRSLFNDLLDSKNLNAINFANPEIFMLAKTNKILLSHLKNAKFNFIDGNGLLMLINHSLKTNYNSESRFPGTDFLEYIPETRKVKIFLYGANPENNEKAAKKIEENFPNIKISGRIDGYTNISDSKLIEKINKSSPDIVIICLGCPKQEEWISKNKSKIKAKIIFGNGGSIDFWSGNVKRAPNFFIKHRIEFIYRLFQDFTPKRFKRQMKIISFIWNMKNNKYKVESCIYPPLHHKKILHLDAGSAFYVACQSLSN